MFPAFFSKGRSGGNQRTRNELYLELTFQPGHELKRPGESSGESVCWDDVKYWTHSEPKVLTLDLSNMVSVPTPGSPERTQLGDRKPIKTIQLEPHFDEEKMYFDFPNGARATITRDEIDSLSAKAGLVPGISFEEQAPEVRAKHERLLQELYGAALAKALGSPELPVMGAIFDRPHAGRNKPEKIGLDDPCPCGSGEQYGKCHGKSKGAGAHDSARKEIIILDTDRKRVTDKQRAGALNALAIRYHNLGRYKEAQRAGERASEIYQRLAAQNPDDFEPPLAGTFYNLSLTYKALGQDEDALRAGERSVEILERLAPQNPDLAPYLAMGLNNLSNRYNKLGQYEKGLLLVEQAVRILEPLAAENPDAFEDTLAISLANLGNHYAELGRHEKAVQPTERALEILDRAATKDPVVFEPSLAMSLNCLGSCYGELGQCEEAQRPAERSVEIYQRLATQNPSFEPDLAMSLDNLGVLYYELGRHEEALRMAERASEIYQRLAEQNPGAFGSDFAISLTNLVNHYDKLGRNQEGQRPAEQLVEIYQRLAAKKSSPAQTGV